METENRLVEGKVLPSLVVFALPFLAANILQTLYGTVDVLVVGRFASTSSVSAVSCGAQLMNLITFLMLGFTNAGSLLIGRFIGAKDPRTAARLIGTAVWCYLGIAVIFAVLMLIFHPVFLRLLNVPDAAFREARQYVFICACGIPLITGYNAVCAILRGKGDSRSPLLFVGVACCVNIVGDLLLTGVLGFGARGVAIATVTAQGVSFLFALFFLVKRGLGLPFDRKCLAFSGDLAVKLLKMGVPLALQSSLVNLSFLFITSIINTMGVDASAATGVADKLISFAFLPNTSFGSAISVMAAQNMGAGKPERALKSAFCGMIISVCWGSCFCLLCQLMPTLLPSVFTRDPSVQYLAGLYMHSYSIDAVLTAVMFCFDGLFSGSGYTTFTMAQNLFATFLVRVPATWLIYHLVSNVNLFQIGLAAPASTLVSVAIYLVFLTTGTWKKLAGASAGSESLN